MEKISWTDLVRNEKVLLRVQEGKDNPHTIKRKKANWICHMLRRNGFLNLLIEGKIKGRMEVTGRRDRRSKQLMNGPKENRGYWRLKEETLARSL
jgi:hypothetical protein